MTSLLFGISLSAALSITSLLVVLTRVSPLTTPGQAIPALLASTFLTVSSIATLLLFALWKVVPIHTWDIGKLLSISLRQGILLGLGTVTIFVFLMLGLLNWWIGFLIYSVFLLIELAINA